MTRRVFLHVGLPKTGTTYLQDTVWTNKQALGAAGLLLPGRHRRRHLLASLDVREDPKLARRAGDVTAPWQDLVDEALAWDGDVLISHEFFASAAPHQVERVVKSFPGVPVHVLVTARSMVDLGISRWQEWVKNGGQAGIDSYPPKDDYDPSDEWGWASFDLADVLARWGSVVPHDRVHVLPMASSGADPRDLWLRFASVLGLDGEDVPAPPAAANRSLGLVEVELLRRVNARLTGFESAGDRGRWIRGYLGEGDVLPATRERFRPAPEHLSELVRRGGTARRMLEEEGFDVVGRADLLEPGDVSQRRHPEEASDTELLDAATQAIANLLTDVRSLTRERNRLAGQVARHPDPGEVRVSVPRPWTRLRAGFRTKLRRGWRR